MVHLLFIVLYMLIFALVEFAFFDCLATRPPRWGWWLVFILSGFCPTTLDLTSGNITIAPLSVLMLGVQMYWSGRGPGASWIIAFSLPVGALLWLWKGKFWERPQYFKSAPTGGL